MPSEVDDDRLDELARDRLAMTVAEEVRQGELLALEDQLGLPKRQEVREKRGPGRPPGARNKRTESLAAQVERLFGNPVLRAAALATMPIDEMVQQLGINALEAVQEQRLWLAMLLPYVAARMPVSDKVTVMNPDGSALGSVSDDRLEERLKMLLNPRPLVALPRVIEADAKELRDDVDPEGSADHAA